MTLAGLSTGRGGRRVAWVFVVGWIAFWGPGCHKKKAAPPEPVPEPMFPNRKLSDFDTNLDARIREGMGALCRRTPLWGRAGTGDGSGALASVLGRKEDASACLSSEEGSSEACRSFWESLERAVSQGVVCSPAAVLGGRRPPTVTPDLLVRSAAVRARKAGKPGSPGRFRVLLLAGMALWDMARGPVSWDTLQAVSKAQEKLGRLLGAEVDLVASKRRGRLGRGDRLESALARLCAARPPVRGPLLGEHLRVLARLGLPAAARLKVRADTGSAGNGLLPPRPLSSSAADRRAYEDLAALIRVAAVTSFDAAWEACPPGELLSVCRARLVRLDHRAAEKLEELRREFAARYEEFPAFQRLVDRLAGAFPPSGGKAGADAAADRGRAVGRYWRALMARVGFRVSPALLALARGEFQLEAALLHVRIQRFVEAHPTRAIFSEVAPLAFKSHDPFSGKPFTVNKTERGLRILPPSESGVLGPIHHEVVLRRR